MTSLSVKKKDPPRLVARTGPALKTFDFIVIDAETEPIELRPAYPPRSVGWATQFPGEKRQYDSFGHPDKNNSTPERAKARLCRAWDSGLPLVFHHGKFDVEVACKHFGLPMLPWERIHDTEYLVFLNNPHAADLKLKSSAERLLGIKPEEWDELRDWIVENIPEARRTKEWGAFIHRAPGDLVGKYAEGDLLRTDKLFRFLLKDIHNRDMMRAYDRERRLMPVLLKVEQQGIRADLEAMERDLPVYRAARERAGDWLRKALKAPDLNLDADRDVGEVLNDQGVVTEWTWTKGGNGRAPQRSISKKSMTLDKFHDQKIAMVYGYYQRMGTVLSMFLEPWIRMASANRGYLKANWNQVRQDRSGKNVGTRTGRPSCNDPNFFNVSKNFENNKGDGYTHPKHLRNLPPLPLVRKYLLPDVGGLWCMRDYNQQELRMLAHYEEGALARQYCERPFRNEDGSMRFDIHSTMQRGFLEYGLELNRDSTKIVDFSTVYGKGVTGLAEDLKVDQATARAILKAKQALMPDVDHPITGLNARVKMRGQQGLPVRTWGGREYYAEPPAFSPKFKRVMDFYYKLLNYLVQGGSAEVTKEAIINYDAHPQRRGRFLVAVYDEINLTAPARLLEKEMAVLRECMETIPTDVPMLSDGKTGENWGDLKKFWNEAEAKEII